MKRLLAMFLMAVVSCGFCPMSWSQSDGPKPFVATIFSDNMVIQRGVADPVWGWTTPGQKVTVALDSSSTTVTADSQGYWIAKLPPMAAGGPHTLAVSGPQSVTFQNVLEGDVWLCSGQSNMEFGVGKLANADQEIAAANYPQIRINLQPHQVATSPQISNAGSWQVCTPDNIKQGGWNGFTAVGYLFGRDLYQKLNIPIGLIESSWGGTRAEAWTSASALRANYTDFDLTLDEAENSQSSYAYLQSNAGATVDTSKLDSDPNTPANLFNGMISPIIPFAIKGAIWYQGESNTDHANQYRTLLPTLIGDWRARWNEGNFPFYIVQLANLGTLQTQPTDDGWAQVRDAQLNTALTVPNTGLALAVDIGDPNNIHPTNKQEVARRLSLWALAKTYGQPGEYSGPIYKGMKVVGNKVVLSFSHVGAGLIAQGGAPLTGFAIAGADGKYVWGDAVIDGENVDVSSSAVPDPVSVHYAWAQNPIFNLYNSDGLPASPFRTDSPPAIKMTALPANAGPDLALGATYVSSDQNQHGWDTGLTDGSWDPGHGTTYASNEDDSFPKTVTVDMKNAAPVSLVEVGVPPFGSTKIIDVSVSADGNSFTDEGSYVFSLNTEERHLYSFKAIPARYVRLTYPDHYDQSVVFTPTFVFTTELAAYAPGNKPVAAQGVFNPGPNYALGASYICSDPNNYGWGGGLTDGSWVAGHGTTFASSNTDSFPKTVVVDLSAPKNVGVVAFGVPPFGSTKTIDVSVSLDGTTYTDEGSYVFTLGKEERHVLHFPAIQARYIKLAYPDHYDQEAGSFVNTYVFTTEVEAYAPFDSH